MAQTHEAVVEYHADDEDAEGFAATCTCGWAGTLRSAVEYAEDDAQEHMELVTV